MWKNTIAIGLLCFASCGRSGLEPADLNTLNGAWTGELTYVDYGSGAPVTIPTTLLVRPLEERTWLIGHGYTEEPQADELDTMRLDRDGSRVDAAEVTLVERMGPDSVRLVLEEDGEDDDRPARIRRTWTIGKHRCVQRKEVGDLGGTAFTLRHEYRFRR